ncbi:MAG: hypothetical protein ABI068_12990 [Ktedonobacterales bacterium]
MSAVLDATPTTHSMTDQERSVLATRRLCEALGLGVVKPNELRRLTIALAEAAADEAGHNSDFAKHIRVLYERSASVKKSKVTEPSTRRKKMPEHPNLTPVGTFDESKFNPYGPLDPYILLQLYGIEQLPLALDGYSLTALKGAVSLVEQRNPGTKPKNCSKKDAVLEYIVQYVTGQGSEQ